MARTKRKRIKAPRPPPPPPPIEIAEQQLANSNSAYTQGVFKYLRVLIHVLGTAQFIYGIYFHWFNVNWPQLKEEEELKTRWGGKFKYLTFLDILQAIYHFLALVNDMFGTNAVNPEPMPILRKIKDYMFAAWAFPVAHNVSITFWIIYAYDRELIFPAELDAIFPAWLNHIVHTNVSMLAILDVFTCFRQYPSRFAGISGTVIFMLLYIIWMHIVRFFSGEWVYPLLEVINWPMRIILLSSMVGFSVLCYLFGEYLNLKIWAPEHKAIEMRNKHKIH
ncbi:androgen-induced gene 1 protein isoform X2 [Teleopsis dalmanni]|uniref:androgen-induced gene 1 protein isoform X2 n=1 Tax=Teleopsis dalmanni TaxID=139649 RepID=UPI0018CF80C7|nr:androgen-induced gene 1 protein isoform X2 [Teleopsis dalmanni]